VKLSVSKKNQHQSDIDLNDLVVDGNAQETILLIGRSKECHIILDDKQISREHSKLIYINGKWRVERISTDTPLLLNQSPIEKSEIVSGDVISISIFTITFTGLEQEVAIVKPEAASVKPEETHEVLYKIPVQVSEPSVQETVPEYAEAPVEEFTDEKSNLTDADAGETGGFSDFGSDIGSEAPAESADVNVQGNNDFFPADSEAPTEISTGGEVAPDGAYSLENISNDESGDDSTKVFNTFAAVHLDLFGEFAPYDKYNLEAGKTFIGRDPNKCQIVLNDPEVSSLHAVLVKNNMMITLEDLNSGNGTLLNGERINRATLNHNDEFIVGSTSFKVKVKSEFLKEESATLMPVDEHQTVEIEEIVEVPIEDGEQINALGELTSAEPEEKSILKRIWKDEQKRKQALYLVVALVAAWVMFGDEEPAKKAPVAQKKEEKSKDDKDVKGAKLDKKDIKKGARKNLTEEEKQALSERYQIGKKHFNEGRYRDALEELQKVSAVDPNFNTSLQTLIALSKEGLSKLEEQEKKRKEEEAAAEKRAKVKALVAKATAYVKDRRADLAGEIFNEIAQIDPENIEISRLKREMEDWTREQKRKELEIVQKKRDREDKVEKLKPGKALYLQKEWFKASGKLSEFLKIKDMDEDLTTEATSMLKTAKEEVSNAVLPLQGKSKSLMEGQDLKGAYEVYQQILRIEPTNPEALNATVEIKDILTAKARKIYREAIISESLSLFQDAKEKFQEVQQVSPVDSDYYKKASDKLKDYLD